MKRDAIQTIGLPAKFAAFIRAGIAKWAKVVKASGATVD